MLFLKILSMLWPFIKEAVLGDKTVMETFRTNKMKFVGVFIIIASLGLNYFVVSKIIFISREHIALLKKYKAMESSKKSPITNDIEVKEESPIPVAAKPPAVAPVPSLDAARHARLQAHMAAIRNREAKEE